MPNETLQRLTAGIEPYLVRIAERFDAELRSDLPCVGTLARHVARYRGKMLRPTLVLLAGQACGANVGATHEIIASVVEMAHMATLVHDDVLDDAELRRRGATINHLRGNEAAVLLGDYLISHAYHLCSSLDDQFAARAIAATMARVCEGELLQLSNRGNTELEEAVYTDIVNRKTAALIAVSTQLGAHYAGASREVGDALYRYGEAIGIAFQIQDDILDLIGDVREVGKSLGSDVTKVKLTLPLIHFLRTAPAEHRELLRGLLKSNDADRPEQVRQLIAPSGSIEFARERAEHYITAAISELNVLPQNNARAALEAAARFVVTRSL